MNATLTRSQKDNFPGSPSLWMDVSLPIFPALEQNIEVDVCIVGGGIVGLTCAYVLALQGKSVAVLEQGALGSGQTAHTTGHLTWVLDDRFAHLESMMGTHNAQQAVESHLAAVDYIEKIIKKEKIECDFERVDAFLFNAPNEPQDILEKEYEFIKKIGLEVEKLPKAPFNSDFDTGACLRFPNQAQFHVLKYLKGLTEVLSKNEKVKIFGHTHVSEVIDGTPCLIKTLLGHQVKAQNAIMATCTPVNNRFYIHTKQFAYRTYVIAARIPQGSFPRGLYYDTDHPYHYIRVQRHLTIPHLDWVIVGGEDHRVGQDFSEEDKYLALEIWMRQRIMRVGKVEYQWSGEIFEPIDSLAYIGQNPGDKHVYIATGDSGNGLTHGTIAGILLPVLIKGEDHPWKKLYAPSRKTIAALPTFVKEMCNSTAQYRDWLTPGEAMELSLIQPEEGIILRKGLKKFAVYKDINHVIHIQSACCPHLGGCVRWNSDEKTWDCPCHGSSFDSYGNVICGPSIDSLKKINKEDL